MMIAYLTNSNSWTCEKKRTKKTKKKKERKKERKKEKRKKKKGNSCQKKSLEEIWVFDL